MAGSGTATSYRQLNDRSNQCARMFRALGLAVGDTVALYLENNPRFFEICWAAQRSGLYFTAISTQLLADEVAYIVKDSGARLFITSRAMGATAAALRDRMPGVRHWIMVDGAIAGYESYEDLVSAQPLEPIGDETKGTDLLYSSGTTGRPKGIRRELTGDSIDAVAPSMAMVRDLYALDDDTVYLSPAPLYHSAPLRFNMAVQRVGGTCVIMESFDAERALQLIGEYRATHSQWVPAMFVRMLKLPPAVREQYDLSSMRIAIHAAAPCPVPIKEQMIAWWGPAIVEYYAGTEGNGFCHINSRQWLEHKGSVGTPLFGSVHILDDDGAELPAGGIGTIYFADGPEFEYLNDAEKTAQSRSPKGWTTLGDIGYVDDEGYLYLTDRKAHMIISGGVNIYPQEAENLLITHPRVNDVAVIGVPSAEFGEEVKAVVQPVAMSDAGSEFESELIGFCRARLSHIKCPKSIDFEPELPRHANGKLYKRLLRERYWAGHGSRII